MNNSQKPRVSIGMPVFNGERYIDQALDWLLTQTFSDFELIIADNASTDKTQEICQAYVAKDRRIRYYRNEANLGAAKNYNLVLELSLGEYFKWAAYDDLCAPKFLERCIEILDHEPDVVLCYPKTSIIDENGEFVENYFDGFHLCSSKPHERFRNFFRAPGLCNPIAGLIRTSIVKKTPAIGNYAASDRILLGELALYGQFYEVPEYLFLRRGHPERSLEANVTDDEIAAWFDPTVNGLVLSPRWKRFLEYLKVIKRVPLGWSERVRCYIELMRYYLVVGRLQEAMKDLRQAVRVVS